MNGFKQVKYFIKYIISLLILISACVGPPQYSDGLLENIPAIVNESDYFSLSLLGEDYTDEIEWDLVFTGTIDDIIHSTFIVKDLNINPSDSTFVFMLDEQGDTLFIAGVFNDITFTSQDSIINIGIPNKITFNANNFTGRIDYHIIRQP